MTEPVTEIISPDAPSRAVGGDEGRRFDVLGVDMTGAEAAQRLIEVLQERTQMNHHIHGLKQELHLARGRVSLLTTWLGVDENDEAAVRQLVEDMKALKRYKRRTAMDKLRVGESFSADHQAHYEQKLASKRRQIRQLMAANERLRAELSPAAPLQTERPQ